MPAHGTTDPYLKTMITAAIMLALCAAAVRLGVESVVIVAALAAATAPSASAKRRLGKRKARGRSTT